jgi:hypothetical protein
MNKVSTTKYTPNKYTGRSLMYNGGKKKMGHGGMSMGQSPMEMDMDRKMKTQMAGGGEMYGMRYGSMVDKDRMKKGHGGKASSDIYAMEDACNRMAGYNKSLPKGR